MFSFGARILAATGGYARGQWLDLRYVTAVLATGLFLAAQPSQLRRTVRSVFARQVLFSGVESVRFICVLAVLVGLTVVVQAQVWVGRAGQSQMIGPLLVAVVARELGPLFANFVLIVRSGSAIATELGVMKVGGEVRVLEAQGIEPLVYLVLPRVLGLAVAALCLTTLFVLVAFASGYVFGVWIGSAPTQQAVFLTSVFKAFQPLDAFSILIKSVLPALLTSTICATEGLSVGPAMTEVPLAAKRALARSLGVLFVVSVLISLLTYL